MVLRVVSLARSEAVWPIAGHEDDARPHHDFRFPAEIMARAVWLNHGFGLSLREIELILAQRGIVESCGSIRAWGPAVRASVRQHAQATLATAGCYMAFGQGLRSHPRRHRLSDDAYRTAS
jgi:hypothetical protein